MLAEAAATAVPSPVHLEFSHRFLPFAIVNFLNNCGSSKKWGGTTRARTRMAVKAGYTRRPMETAGAYQLIDEATGEKFIIWGGTDDDKNYSPLPSEGTLIWKPSPDNSSNSNNIAGLNSSRESDGNSNPTVTTSEGGQGACSTGAVRSFGRLKAQRVRDLVRKTDWMKQDINSSDHEEQIVENTLFQGTSSHFHPASSERRLDALKDRPKPLRVTKSLATTDMLHKAAKEENRDHSKTDIEQGGEELSKHQTTMTKYQKSGIQIAGSDISVSKYSTASLRGWGNRESMHNFGANPIDTKITLRKSSADNKFFSRKSFRDLGCSDYMVEFLKGQLFVRPSHIQAMAFAPVIGGKSCIIADQSGSGKTLAYLIPVIQRLREEEVQGIGKSLPQNPRVVVLVPTSELASQVLHNCRLISKLGVPFRSMVATGGFRERTQLENLQQDIDVLIATPGRFVFLIKEGFLQLANLRCAVLDEVDILFNNEDFEPVLQSLIKSSPVATQYLFVTATLPIDIYYKVLEVFPDCEVIMGPGVHRTSPGLDEILVDCSGDGRMEKTPDTAFLNKISALLQLVEETPVTKTIIFCNKIETCRKVENALKRFDRKGIRLRVLPFHTALALESRVANMAEFRCSQLKDSSLFLVCTDRASRGIDIPDVDNVVLFDYPRDPSEYVRRVGRTARGPGGKGKAFIFVVGKQVSLAKRIIERNRRGHPLHDVPSNM